MNILYANTYVRREDLESEVKGLVGASTEKNTDIEIHGTREELARLQLSASTSVWGVRCVVLDESPPDQKVAVERPQRGELKDFGLNGNVKKISDIVLEENGKSN